MGARDEAEREIAESVAALAMLRQQICGMYALLQERGRQEVELAERLEDAEERLQQLLAGLPRDPMTLAAIQRAAQRVEASGSVLPGIVQTAIGEVGKQAAQGLAQAVAPHVQDLARAAFRAEQAAKSYEQAVDWAHVKVIAAGMAVSVAALLAAVAWWVPSLQEIQARRAERAQLAAAVEDLERRGGRAQLNVCGDKKRLCVLVNEGAGGWGPVTLPKGQVYRVIQGY